jgi:hypothetical protein
MSIPMTREQVVNRYFLEMRCKVLEVAASLDRVDRAAPSGNGSDDPRLEQLRRAVRVLLEAGPGRAEKVQQIFSREYDPNWRKKS